MLPSLLVFHFFYIGRSYCSLDSIINFCMNISFLLMPISILFPKFIDLITPVLLYAAVVTANTSISTRKIVKFITVTLLLAALCFYHDSRIGMVIVLCSLLLFISIKVRLIHFLSTQSLIAFVSIVAVISFIQNQFTDLIQNQFTDLIQVVFELFGRVGLASHDTRSFLYLEVFANLTEDAAWLLGSGYDGMYFSQFFYDLGRGDHHLRIDIEVGFLALLLKTGLVGFFALLIFIVSVLRSAYSQKLSKFKEHIILLVLNLALIFIQFPFGFTIFWILFFLHLGFLSSRVRT
jgi:hypothetical protein